MKEKESAKLLAQRYLEELENFYNTTDELKKRFENTDALFPITVMNRIKNYINSEIEVFNVIVAHEV